MRIIATGNPEIGVASAIAKNGQRLHLLVRLHGAMIYVKIAINIS